VKDPHQQRGEHRCLRGGVVCDRRKLGDQIRALMRAQRVGTQVIRAVQKVEQPFVSVNVARPRSDASLVGGEGDGGLDAGTALTCRRPCRECLALLAIWGDGGLLVYRTSCLLPQPEYFAGIVTSPPLSIVHVPAAKLIDVSKPITMLHGVAT